MKNDDKENTNKQNIAFNNLGDSNAIKFLTFSDAVANSYVEVMSPFAKITLDFEKMMKPWCEAVEPFAKISSDFEKMIKPWCEAVEPFAKVSLDFEKMMKPWCEAVEPFAKVSLDFEKMTKPWCEAVEPFAKMSLELEKSLKPWYAIIEPLASISEALEKSIRNDFLFENTSSLLQDLTKFTKENDFSHIIDDVYTIDDCEKNDITKPDISFSSEEVEEFTKDISSLPTSLNWQQTIYSLLSKWKEKNPVIAYILIFVVINIFNNILDNSISFGITSHFAKVKETPSKDGVVIQQININQEVTIVNDCSYYYEVIIVTEDEQELQGWVAKRNIKTNNQSSANEEIE